MASPLLKLKKQIAQGFKGKLCKGIILRAVVDSLDDYGDPETSSTTQFTFEGIRDNFDARYATQAEIPQTDVRILILLGSVKPTQIVPVQTDMIFIGAPFNVWHQIRRILTVDPAGASITMQAFQIPDPTVT